MLSNGTLSEGYGADTCLEPQNGKTVLEYSSAQDAGLPPCQGCMGSPRLAAMAASSAAHGVGSASPCGGYSCLHLLRTASRRQPTQGRRLGEVWGALPGTRSAHSAAGAMLSDKRHGEERRRQAMRRWFPLLRRKELAQCAEVRVLDVARQAVNGMTTWTVSLLPTL